MEMSTMLTAQYGRLVGLSLDLTKSTRALPPAPSISYDVLIRAPKCKSYHCGHTARNRAGLSEHPLALREQRLGTHSTSAKIEAIGRSSPGGCARQQYGSTLTTPTHSLIALPTRAARQPPWKRGTQAWHLDSSRRQLHVSPVQRAQPELIVEDDRAVHDDAAAGISLPDGALKRKLVEPLEQGSHRVPINRAGKKYFTPEEDATVLDMEATGHTYAEIADRTGRTVGSLAERVGKIRVRELRNPHPKRHCPTNHESNAFHRYRSEEDAKIREMTAARQTAPEIAMAIGRSTAAIKMRLANLRGPRSVANMQWSLSTSKNRAWTREDDVILCEMLSTQQSMHTISDTLRRSTCGVNKGW